MTMMNPELPNEKTNWDMNIGPDGCDLDYKGSDPDWRREKDLISTEFGLITVGQYRKKLEEV